MYAHHNHRPNGFPVETHSSAEVAVLHPFAGEGMVQYRSASRQAASAAATPGGLGSCPGWPLASGVQIVNTRSWRFVCFDPAALTTPGAVIYVSANPDCLRDIYLAIWPLLFAAGATHRHTRNADVLALLNRDPSWMGKSTTVAVANWAVAERLALDIDAVLAGNPAFSGPAPTVRTDLVGPRSGLVYGRRLFGAGDGTSAPRRRKLTDLLG